MSPSGSRDWAILASKLISKATTQLPDYLEDPSGGSEYLSISSGAIGTEGQYSCLCEGVQ